VVDTSGKGPDGRVLGVVGASTVKLQLVDGRVPVGAAGFPSCAPTWPKPNKDTGGEFIGIGMSE
jgi:hypothetical protein